MKNKLLDTRYALLKTGLIILILFNSAFVSGEQLNKDEIVSAVETWVRYVTADARLDAYIVKMEPYYNKNKEIVAYIAHLNEEGFCLCGASDHVLPVYLYSPFGNFDSKNRDLNYILEDISNLTAALKDNNSQQSSAIRSNQSKLDERKNFWQNLIGGVNLNSQIKLDQIQAEPLSMELPLSSQWSQGSPYNDNCPEFIPGGDTHVPVGCIATAMAQIMYYWKWPNTGEGVGSVIYNVRWRTDWDEEPLSSNPGTIPGGFSGRLEWTSNNGGRLRMNGRWDNSIYSEAFNLFNDNNYRIALSNLYNRLNSTNTTCSANFGSSTYDWSIIQDTHQDPVDAGDLEVAELSYHAGIALDITYGVWGSLASSGLIPTALYDHFRYEPDGIYEIITSPDKLTAEIQWLRPAEMRGVRPSGGAHGWVVYGYNKGTDPNRQFLMNMGWGPATSHVWYTLDNVGLQFTLHQYHATQLAPKDIVKFVGNTTSGDGSPDNPYTNIEEAVTYAPNGSTLIFKAGSEDTFTGSIVITKALKIKGKNILIKKQ